MKFDRIWLNGLYTLVLPIANAKHTDPYVIKGVDGLGPTEADVFIVDTAEAGGVFQGRRPRNREIVMLIGLNEDYTDSEAKTVEELREDIYVYFNSAMAIELWDGITSKVRTTGYVSKCEIALFAKQQALQLTIPTTSPYFEGTSQVLTIGDGLTYNTLEQFEVTFVPEGTAPTGMVMKFTLPNAAPNGFGISYPGFGERMFIDRPFNAGDEILVDTRIGSRDIRLGFLDDSPTLLPFIDAYGEWAMIHKRPDPYNYVTINITDPAGGYFEVEWDSIEYKPQYLGA